MTVKVKVISRLQHRKTREYHDPGEELTLEKEHAEHLVDAGCVEILKAVKPGEDKAQKPTEDKAQRPDEVKITPPSKNK